MIVEIPRSHTTEITTVRFPGLQVEVLKDVFHVVPVLHKKRIGMVNNDQFDGRQEVIIPLLLTMAVSVGASNGGARKLTLLGP